MILICFILVQGGDYQYFTTIYLWLKGMGMDEIKYNRIQIILVEFDIDQLELAQILKVNRNSVSRWCRNVVQPSLYQLREIAAFFRIDIRLLIEPTTWAHLTGPAPVDLYKEEKRRRAKERSAIKKKALRKRS